MSLIFELEEDEISLVMDALSDRPIRVAGGVYSKIARQIVAHQQAEQKNHENNQGKEAP